MKFTSFVWKLTSNLIFDFPKVLDAGFLGFWGEGARVWTARFLEEEKVLGPARVLKWKRSAWRGFEAMDIETWDLDVEKLISPYMASQGALNRCGD